MAPSSLDAEQLRLKYAASMRIRAAAVRARKLYPDAVGELIYRELISWEETGYRFGGKGLIARVVDQIMNMAVKTEEGS